MIVVDCLGRERTPDKFWPDGSYNCPFCNYACSPAGCPNPACFARVSPPFPADMAREIIRKQEASKREEDERSEIRRWSLERAREQSNAQKSFFDSAASQARAVGACERCARSKSDFYRSKIVIVRHRKRCPLERV